MCTFSFIPGEHGYYAAMNRDERLTRRRGLSPELVSAGDLMAVYPREPEGGTWIACNERGITLAMLNWNLPDPRGEKLNSRGSVIPQLIAYGDLPDLAWKLSSLSLEGILPFRLVGIFWPQDQVCEFRWDGASLQRLSFSWQPRHWFSSGLSDEEAQRERGETCRLAWTQPEAGTLPWLRALHASHGAAAGPFSICVHREDAETVSYSEIEYRPSELTFTYTDGAPCRGLGSALHLPLFSRRDPVVA
jgi:hypothetical protein